MLDSLWPVIDPASLKRSPEEVLNEQADALSRHSNNVLKGLVSTRTAGDVRSTFYIVAPFFNNYRYELFIVLHHIVPIYPTDVLFKGNRTTCGDETALLAKLKEIFSHENTREIMSSLITQSGVEGQNSFRSSSLSGSTSSS
jgi:hypothetical protein